MPPRWVCVAIVAFWLGTNGWLLWQDVWPNLQPGQPPPFTIDLVDEVQLNRPPETVWLIQANGEQAPSYRGRTWVKRDRPADVYTLHFLVKPIGPDDPADAKKVRRQWVKQMDTECRVTPAGHLRGLWARVETTVGVTATLRGEVRGESFLGHYQVDGPGVPITLKGDLDPVPVAHNGAVFLSFHPAQRIDPKYLSPGQTWREPSLGLSLGLQGLRPGLSFVQARVRPDPETVRWKEKDFPCLVIEYTEEEQQMRTWVERKGGLVLKQEAALGNERWVLKRD
jgi:hypothetical protein